MANPFHAPYTVTQPFGCTGNPNEPAYGDCPHFHRGIDLVGPSNTCPIYAVVPGTIFATGQDTDGAIYVIEQADTGHYLCYWHLSKITCSRGQRVDNTVQVGNQGMTGHATGYHCHLEVELPGTWTHLLAMTPTNPTPFLADSEAANDMDPHQIVRDLYQQFTGVIPGDDIINQKADFIATTGNIRQVALDIAQAGGWKADPDWNHSALVSYRATFAIPNENVDQWATDRQQGGDTFDSLVHKELPPILAQSNQVTGLQTQLAVTQTQDQAQIADLTRQNKSLTSQVSIAQDTINHLQKQLEYAQQPSSDQPASNTQPATNDASSAPTAPQIVTPGPVATKPSIQPDNKPFWKKILSLFINF